jgi:hypothetical protein
MAGGSDPGDQQGRENGGGQKLEAVSHSTEKNGASIVLPILT